MDLVTPELIGNQTRKINTSDTCNIVSATENQLSSRVELTQTLLATLRRMLPSYEKDRPDYEVKKVRAEIRYHEKILKELEELELEKT